MRPVKIEVTESPSLKILWNDETVSEISLIELRKGCPCAVCSAEEEGFSHSYKVYRGDEVEISDISVVGSYAVSVAWKDGHNTGLYEFQYLKELAEKEK
ncbi:hypothetical protein MNBD_IGNAVI01-2484 [hydrothermal vent metagenome]|uniref:Gamma-butyrobetaine hydroxylase-like N-terminal domain-containing protein n=1 Tax=hydrothermal vent metagenome TaxID=652676 RepID=A0A3B1C8T6_9ZZZZ